MADLNTFPVTNGVDLLEDWGDSGFGLINSGGVTVNTLAGDDQLKGQGYRGLTNEGKSTIDLGPGDDYIEASGLSSAVYTIPPGNWGHGILNKGGSVIRTGPGHDFIKATSLAHAGIQLELSSLLDLGSGNDEMDIYGGRHGLTIYSGSSCLLGSGNDIVNSRGNIYEGIEVKGDSSRFDAGQGNDYINAKGGAWGVRNWEKGTFELGNGDDYLTGKGGQVGIVNDLDSIIDAGNGDDVIEAVGPTPYQGFGGGGMTLLGRGNDCISGFGFQTVDGGHGQDIARFDFNLDNRLQVKLGSTSNTIHITYTSETMTLMNIERFGFADGTTYTFDEMAEMATL